MTTHTVRLDAVCERIDYGFTASADFSQKEPRFLRITDIQGGTVDWNRVPGCRITPEEEADKRLCPGDLVFARTGATTGKCFLIEYAPRAVFASYLIRLRANDKILPNYLYAFFQSENYWHQINGAVRGAAQGGVNSTTLSSLVVPLPDLTEQRRIAERLEEADRLCRARRKAVELAGTFLPAAFIELFGDSIENPNGFRIEPLEDLIQPTRPISYGILMPGPDVPTGVPYIRVTDIQDGQVMPTLVRRTTQAIDQAYRRSKLKAGDLLLSIRGHVGRMAIVPPCLDGANITQDTARLATVATLDAHYLMECLASRSMQHRMVGLTRGAAVQGINLGDVKELPIPVPPLSLQRKFAAVVERVEHLRVVQREALRQAEHLFASLLCRAFSG